MRGRSIKTPPTRPVHGARFKSLGQNHKICGFETSQEFVDAMWTGGAAAHLDAFVAFIKANKLDGALRAKNWAAFARGYQRPGLCSERL